MKAILQTVMAVGLMGLPDSLHSEAAADASSLAVETVLKRVVENAAKENENDRAFSQRYGYTREKVMEFRNSKGELKKREEKRIENTPSTSPVTLHLPQANQKLRSVKEPERNDVVSETRSNVRGRAIEKKDLSLNADLLSRFEFALAGRENVNGRPALMLDFKPANRKLPERSIKDRFINKAAGRVWVDEADSVLVRADLHLTEKVNVLGGLVGAVQGFDYRFERERTSDGLWFTRAVDWHLEGREVVVGRILDYHEKKMDVRKAW